MKPPTLARSLGVSEAEPKAIEGVAAELNGKTKGMFSSTPRLVSATSQSQGFGSDCHRLAATNSKGCFALEAPRHRHGVCSHALSRG